MWLDHRLVVAVFIPLQQLLQGHQGGGGGGEADGAGVAGGGTGVRARLHFQALDPNLRLILRLVFGGGGRRRLASSGSRRRRRRWRFGDGGVFADVTEAGERWAKPDTRVGGALDGLLELEEEQPAMEGNRSQKKRIK